jgi:DNA-binding NtrC family response regulator
VSESASDASRRRRILVVDDEETQREMLRAILEREHYEVATAGDGAEALTTLEQGGIELVLSDQRMPKVDGLELLKRARDLDPELPFILMTAYGSVSSAVEAMKRGASDYLEKPFEREELLLVLAKVAQRQRLITEVRSLRAALERDRAEMHGIVGTSAPMQEVFSLIERVADTDASVLITGESGTGKELVARAIHARSKRSERLLVALNCAAVPEHLLESEFFGHEKGAFSGAFQRRAGVFEQADGGTLFLDEIGAMRFDLQAKLLRAIQEREVQRLGGAKPVPVDVRILAATSEDLEEAIGKRQFREDLYYRLNVVPITLPPLRDRIEDVPLLVRHFLRRAAERFGREVKDVAPEVVDRLAAHAWPGNVRELQNVVERMVVLARDPMLTEGDLPPALRAPRAPRPGAPPAPPGATDGDDGDPGAFTLPHEGLVMDDLERHLIVQALRRSNGSLGPAARLVGLTYKTLQYRIRKYRIEKGDY